MPSRRARRTVIAGAAVSNSRSKKAAQAAPEPTAAAATQAGLTSDTTKQLTDLKGLLDNGILTQAEFDAKKAQILGL